MAQKIRVSIIVPVYNVAPYIADCLKSVMHQTYSGSMECLLVDDCGTDDSIAIAEQMIAAYEGPIRFQILHHEWNRGLSAARNTGTKVAKGEYLYYLDSDDEITEDCIARLMGKVAEYPDVEMVQGNAYRHLIGGGFQVEVKGIVLPYVETNEEVRKCWFQYGQFPVTVWNKLLKKEFIFNNNIYCMEGIIHEDILYTFDLIRFLRKVAFLPEITYNYKRRLGSITTSTTQRIDGLNWCKIYREILYHMTSGHEQDEFDYFGKKISREYIRFVREVPEFEETLQLCKEKAKVYGSRSFQLRLAFISVLGHLKYGKEIWTLLGWLKHPVKKIKAKLNAADFRSVFNSKIIRFPLTFHP